jgi:Holliday junction DNA helicase RuvA
MIAYLSGVVRDPGVIATAGGVGYRVLSPTPLVPGDSVELEVSSITSRDGAVTLYGFTNRSDQGIFLALVSLPGVGASTALALLRDLGASGVARAVQSGDPTALAKARGVGKSVAAKICALARDRLPTVDSELSGPADELIAALVGLGFDESDARRAAAESPGDDLGDRLRHALALLREAG